MTTTATFALVPLLALAGCGARSGLPIPDEQLDPQCPESPGAGAWTQVFGGAVSTYDEGSAIATDAEGSVFVSGVGTLQMSPCAVFESHGSGPGFLAKFDARGNLLWEWRTGFNQYWGSRVASDGAGGVLFVISVEGGEDLGSGLLRGGRYVGRADAAGTPLFMQRIETGGAVIGGVDASPEWGVVVASSCVPVQPDLRIPSDAGADVAEACPESGHGSAVVQRFSPEGELLWTEVLTQPSGGYVDVSGAAFTATGGVVLAGKVPDTLTYGDGTVDSDPLLGSPWHNEALFVARYDEQGGLGAHRFMAGTPAPGHGAFVSFASVTVDPISGAIFLGATLYGAPGSFDLGGGPVGYVGAQSASTNVLARLDAGLAHVWSFSYGADGDTATIGVHGDGDGGVIALTADNGTYQAGAFTVAPASPSWTGHLVVASGDGTVTGVHGFDAEINGVALGQDGEQLMTGSFERKADLGTGPQVPDELSVSNGFAAAGAFW